jgi:hypothetical protein
VGSIRALTRAVAGAAVALVLAAGIVAAEASERLRPEVASTGGGSALLDMVVLWLASNFGLQASFEHPELVLAPPGKLARLRYGEEAEDTGDVVAVYSGAEQTIYLGESWDGRTPADLSVVVHEMVHHLQDAAGMRFACPGEREAMAYAAQERWLQMFGQGLASEFAIDPMTLMLRTTCAW